MRYLNLGVLAHIDAGKTSLTERLLFQTGVIRKLGSVDAGTTQTDTLALEQQRGITIKAAVAVFVKGDVQVNLIDTPGHPDFIAEVERALSVLDGAVLVLSAVEGVQAQTRVLMRALQRLRIPTLLFINKIDRRGAQEAELLARIAEKLTPAIVPLGTTRDLGTRAAAYRPFDVADPVHFAFLIDRLTRQSDAFLAEYLADEAQITPDRLQAELAAQTRRGLVHPVLFGSAITGAGVEDVIAGIVALLPTAEGDPTQPAAGSVFKIERGAAGEKIAYVRMTSGVVRVRDRMQFGREGEGRVTAVAVCEPGGVVRAAGVAAGQIGKLWGLNDIRIGDALGTARHHADARHFAPPTLETLVVPARTTERSAVHMALAQLTEQDPLINLRQSSTDQDTVVSLYGEVQKEVIQETLRRDYGLEATFLESTTIHIERPSGSGEAIEVMGQPGNPFAATIGLRVEPGPLNSGITYGLEVELGSLPLSYHKAVEETVRRTLTQGLQGWEVLDCRVTMTRSGFDSVGSTAGDFRNLTPLVLMSALQTAGTQVFEPLHRFQLEIPADTYGHVLPVLARLRALPQTPVLHERVYRLEGLIPVARVHELHLALPGLTRGEGVLEYAFDHYQPVRGPATTRPRFGPSPLNRQEYLLEVVRRVPGRATNAGGGDGR